MRLIDADAIIEVMQKCAENPENKQALLCYRYTQRILEEAPTVEPFAPWHRVEEELPKSGTHVLVCCEVRGICGHRSRYVCDAFHTDAKSIPCRYDDDIDSEYDEETDEYYFPEGWWEVIKNWDDYTCVAIADFVTHWMPLPEPPKEDA